MAWPVMPDIQTLTREVLQQNLRQLIAVSADVSPWTGSHFLADLPRKWEMSFMILDPEPVGYVILSEKQPGWLHIHQFMIAAARRGSGLGRLMMQEAKRRSAGAGQRLSLKVAAADASAIRFYRREGFQAGEVTGLYLWMRWEAEAPVS